jgi:hypothetical protein
MGLDVGCGSDGPWNGAALADPYWPLPTFAESCRSLTTIADHSRQRSLKTAVLNSSMNALNTLTLAPWVRAPDCEAFLPKEKGLG